MVELIGLWSYAIAATLYAMLTVWQLRRGNREHGNRPLVLALAVMSIWALIQGITGPAAMVARLAESARNLAFLGCMYAMIRSALDAGSQRAVKAVYGAVAGVIGLQIVLAVLAPRFSQDAAVNSVMISTAHSFGLTIAAGSLILVHNLYGQASPASRAALQLPVIALAAMWAYDLHLYTLAYLTGQTGNALFALRGGMAAILVPLFALASRSGAEWRVKLSRSATFQSLSMIAILIYFIVMMSLTRAMDGIDGGWAQIAQLAIIAGMTGFALALVLLPSGKPRAWLRVIVSKHFFEHRYDYRTDWLRFTRAIGQTGADGAPLGERIVKALADMAGSPGGLLLLVDEGFRLSPAARWNWRNPDIPSGEAGRELGRLLESNSYVIDFSAIKDSVLKHDGCIAQVPDWLLRLDGAWAGIPLVHNDRLAGLVILQSPTPRRALDWEDYDLFRTAGIQAASYIAEAQSHEALADVQRFDEFNRRFAFIMHDIKNLVSQLSLVARNAERHAENPEFRADMIATLKSSVKKMNDLLARLSRGNIAEAQPPRPVLVHSIAMAVAASKRSLHSVELAGDARLEVLADPARLEQALSHLVQNAIDASPDHAPVRIAFAARESEVAIEVADSGMGMSADFIRSRLFHPFASTKEGGFGVGAFESRTLIAAMGGRIDVASREGEGSRFTIFLPAAMAHAAHRNQPAQQWMRA